MRLFSVRGGIRVARFRPEGGGVEVQGFRRKVVWKNPDREYNLFQEKKIEEFEVGTEFWYMCSDRKY